MLVITQPNVPRPTQLDSMDICGATICTTDCARDLGVHFDCTLHLEDHINHICRAANFHLYRNAKIRKYLTLDAAKKIVQAFVISRIDYCNCLLLGLPDTQLNRLQRLQNRAARVITMRRKQDHIMPTLMELHFLPVRQRIQFKCLMLTYN